MSITTTPDIDPQSRLVRDKIKAWIAPLRLLVDSGKNELAARGFPDTIGGADLDVAQQVITQIEIANNR